MIDASPPPAEEVSGTETIAKGIVLKRLRREMFGGGVEREEVNAGRNRRRKKMLRIAM